MNNNGAQKANVIISTFCSAVYNTLPYVKSIPFTCGGALVFYIVQELIGMQHFMLFIVAPIVVCFSYYCFSCYETITSVMDDDEDDDDDDFDDDNGLIFKK